MATIVVESDSVSIPQGVDDLAAFRQWFHSDEFPEKGLICFFNGEVWVDMSKEQFFSHNQVKSEFNRVLANFVRARRLGRYVPDGMLLSNAQVGFSVQPDGLFVSRRTFEKGVVQLVEGSQEGYLELEGTPDMVLEVISKSSVEKDTETLRELYWQAGIPEYWLVDARGNRAEFDLLRHSTKAYVSTRK